MNNKQLNHVLYLIRKGATIKQIAKHYEIPLRTFTRKIAKHKEDVKIARNYYQSYVEGLFK